MSLPKSLKEEQKEAKEAYFKERDSQETKKETKPKGRPKESKEK